MAPNPCHRQRSGSQRTATAQRAQRARARALVQAQALVLSRTWNQWSRATRWRRLGPTQHRVPRAATPAGASPALSWGCARTSARPGCVRRSKRPWSGVGAQCSRNRPWAPPAWRGPIAPAQRWPLGAVAAAAPRCEAAKAAGIRWTGASRAVPPRASAKARPLTRRGAGSAMGTFVWRGRARCPSTSDGAGLCADAGQHRPIRVLPPLL